MARIDNREMRDTLHRETKAKALGRLSSLPERRVRLFEERIRYKGEYRGAVNRNGRRHHAGARSTRIAGCGLLRVALQRDRAENHNPNAENAEAVAEALRTGP